MLEKYEELQVGKVYSSYRTVCEVLCVEEKTGGARQSQIANWGLNFTWRKDKYKWIVLSVHEDEKAVGRGVATAAMLRLGILAYLKREVETGVRVRIRNRNSNPNLNLNRITF